jgi:hypothetical protein
MIWIPTIIFAILGVEGACDSFLTGVSVWPNNLGATLVIPSSVAYTNYTLQLTTSLPLTNIVVSYSYPYQHCGNLIWSLPTLWYASLILTNIVVSWPDPYLHCGNLIWALPTLW